MEGTVKTILGTGWKGPPLVKEGHFFLYKGHLKIQFHNASFNSPYQRSYLKLKEGANVH